jgi:hypothetical protein
MRTYSYDGPPYKAPLAQARVESGSMWLSVDGGPKLWVAPFGPVKRSLEELRDYVRNARGEAAAQAAA